MAENKPTEQPPLRRISGSRIFIFILGLLFLVFLLSRNTSEKEITWAAFEKDMLQEHAVAKVEVTNGELAEIYIKPELLKNDKYKDVSKNFMGGVNPGPHYYLMIGSVESFEHKLELAQANFDEKDKISVVYAKKSNWWINALSWLLPLALLWFFYSFMFRRMGATGGKGFGLFDFAKSNPVVYEKEKSVPVTFKDVAGYDEAKTEIMEIVEFLKHPDHFTKLGAKIPKGILLVGAPGTGKTLLAKAVAGEAGVPFFSLGGSEFIEMFVGVGASRMRDLFDQAKAKAPSIIFIDEIDTIGRVRSRALSMQANEERDSTLNQLLAEMDGFDPNTGVILLAATNRPDILDPALLRPGRFDRHIHLELPNKKERLAIFKVHLAPLLLDKSVDAENLAAQTPGFSGADIASVCNEAALIAARKNKTSVDGKDFSDAIDRIVAGLEKKTRIISPNEKKVIACHEAGHAVVSWMLEHADALQKVSIIPRGKSLGSTWYLPEERQIVTRSQFIDQLCSALGGRTAEELVFHETSSGAIDDLEKVTKQAYMMVVNLGMSDKVGEISYYDSTGMYESLLTKPYSESTAQLIDEEVRKLVNEVHERTKEVLVKNREKLDQLAQLLLEKEVVDKTDLERILGKREWADKKVSSETASA
ncbi:MAG TPA: ATP-dependent zinc metalloprotease FtsH [Bacteroidia bacterium]|jgi:cell division protease FtsH|nr:ATP-dependent zinc metalloprotease FtsH [Bacteroidia bacterium]